MSRNTTRSSNRHRRNTFDTATMLAEIGPLSQWLPVLETLLPTGVADTQQLQQASGLSRDQVNRLVKRFDTLAPDAILTRVKESIPRPGRRGGTPIIYKLGEVGAALLQENGYPDAHACGLDKSTPIATRAASSMCVWPPSPRAFRCRRKRSYPMATIRRSAPTTW